jgi:hypothetical protein
MFALFDRWRKKRRTARMLAAGAIFSYWDGQKFRYADPFKLWRDLTQDEKVNLERLLPEADDADGRAVDALVAHVCRVFGVTRWDEAARSGLTDLELLHLLQSTLRWTAFVKKNSSPGPTLPPATAAATSSASPGPPNPTRSASSDCTSTATARRPAGPTPPSARSATLSAAM